MKVYLDHQLSKWTSRWVDFVHRYARPVIAVDAVVTVLLAVLVVPRLGFNMDHKRLLDPDLPFQRAVADYARYFPTMDDALLIVVDGKTPEMARDAASRLAQALRSRTESFGDVYLPGSGSFFERNGLLYRSPEELDDFVDHVAVLQPVLAELSQDPSIGNFARLIRLGLEHERNTGQDATAWAAVLDRVSDATVRVFDEYPISISWETLMVRGSALEENTRQVIVVKPVLEFNRLLVAARAMEDIRASARELSLVPERGITVRITGNPALNYEEMFGLAWDIGYSSLGTFVLVLSLIFIAFRSVRLMTGAALTLVAGLVWTLAFAVVAVGELNVLSVTFGVMFLGIGIDFSTHLGMELAASLRTGAAPSTALRTAARRTGSSLAICAVTTMIGLYAFVAAPYRGVAELGLIAGSGLPIIFLQTMTLFPALTSVLHADRPSSARPSYGIHLSTPGFVSRHPKRLVFFALTLAVVCAWLLPDVRFDANVVRMRDPRTESVQTFDDLLSQSSTSPWYVDVVAPNADAADAVAERLRQVDAVASTVTLRDFVPTEQAEKIDILSDAAFMLEAVQVAGKREEPEPIEGQIEALAALRDILSKSGVQSSGAPLAPAVRRLQEQLGRFLARVEKEPDPRPALADLEHILLGNFDAQMKRLRRALRPTEVRLDTLPRDLVQRMLADDGHARVQVFPSEELSDGAAMQRFVDAVRAVEPQATGVAVNLVEFGRATSRSFQQALLFAIIGIAVTVQTLFRRLSDTILVLAPTMLAALLTGGTMGALGMHFTFANIIVLPLLLGAGVDSGIHLVHRARSDAQHLLEGTTAQAVFYSATTTTVSFASLAFAGHRGIAGLGTLLVIGMALTLTANLVILPAFIELRARRHGRRIARQ
jgi:hopanoid biosynthesis associated RND transporter like protein HpnN